MQQLLHQMSPSSPDFNPTSTDSMFATILSELHQLKKMVEPLQTEVASLKAWRDETKGRVALILGAAAVLSAVGPLVVWLVK